MRVVAGNEYRLEKELNTFSGVLESILIHENFSRSSLENNVAIGFVSNKLTSTPARYNQEFPVAHR